MTKQSIDFTAPSLKRAESAVICSPFTLKLLAELAERGVPLRAIAAPEGIKLQYLNRPLGLIPTENALLWLVQVGVLRREVDGQGITDSFRLTPLGFQVLEKWRSQQQFPSPTWRDRFQNFLAQIQPSRFI
ncbi:Npun_F0494 family protein [Pseudanabaena sp. PCC 6802]|uniref:Npun_F0494 family protein n=1 Tax=Pseudanabaena sp. PCC 6802 TaxID=118173 RepID=UPI00034992AC|nr:Npun_F0494 family protein [Pseudanabaena sp. PCC 6802]